jgi:ubiquinone biosynthesis protein
MENHLPLTSPAVAIQRLEDQAGRLHEIVRVLVKYRLAGWLSAIPVPRIHEFLKHSEGPSIKDLTREERIRLAMTELGTTFIKIGQMMSTRPDVVSPELAAELSKLQSQASADPPEVVRACILDELGKPPEEIFARFEPEAFASASVAQVHLAELPTGETVVVKVQKAGIGKRIETDLSILASLAELAEKNSAELRAYEPVRLVAEFRRTILNELDFSRERRNLEAFCRNFADDETVRFPRPWPAFCSRRVLTMDFLDGILGTDADKLHETGADLNEFARRGSTIYLDMIFRDSFYHADPHPGNLMMLPGDVVGILDCGMIGRLDAGLHDDFESLMLAVAQGDAEVVTDTMWRLSTRRPGLRRADLQADLADLLEGSAEGAVSEIDLGKTLASLSAIVRKFEITLQPGLSALLRTMTLLEGTAQALNPRFSLAEVMRPYYSRIVMQRFSPQRLGRRLLRNYREWDRLLQTLPRDAAQSMEQLQEGKLQVRIEHRHLDAIVNRLVLGIIVGALILGSSLLWSMKAPPLVKGVSFFGAAGYLLAIVLGGHLFLAIRRTGKTVPKD